MSLPLTRRIAQAALLVAAGAAPVVGAAGSASAAELSPTTDLRGITALDGANVGETVDDTTQKVTDLAGETGSKAVKKGAPAVGQTLGKSVRTTAPAAQQVGSDVTETAGDVVGDTADTATKNGLSDDTLGKGAPTAGLPQLPLG
ncbi:ATP-binding protein [Streptomyces aureoverticillatus]|nr:ATP-binding protein [Streptomyces aureoverticillatus]